MSPTALGLGLEKPPAFAWAGATLYAYSEKEIVKRLDISSGMFKTLLSECGITNCRFKSGRGNEQKMMSYFDKLALKIRPNKVDGTIN